MKFIICLLLIFSSTANAVIIHPEDIPFSEHPNDNVVGWWGSNASAVAVAPNLVLTTRHQYGGVGSTVQFGGKLYTVAETFNCFAEGYWADIRLARIADSFGAPANLTEFVNYYSFPDEADQEAVIGGTGLGRGAELFTSEEILYGYSWANPREIRWGTNYISDAEGLGLITKSGYVSRVMLTNFTEFGLQSPHGVIRATEHECAIANHDSGGGIFIQQEGEWLVAGLSAYVDHGGESWFNNRYSGTADPDKNYFIRVSSYTDFLLDPAYYNDEPIVMGDANWDGFVDDTDLEILAFYWGTTELEDGMTWWGQGDFNSDMQVDVIDLGLLATNHTPEPTCLMWILSIFLFKKTTRKRKIEILK